MGCGINFVEIANELHVRKYQEKIELIRTGKSS